MSFKSIYVGIMIVLMGIVIFGFNLFESGLSEYNQTKENWGSNAAFVRQIVSQVDPQVTTKKKELLFSVHSNYLITENINRTITKRELHAAKVLADLIEYYPSIPVENYEAVWIKSLFGEEDISLMSKGDEINQDQKTLLEGSEIGSFIEIVINFKNRDSVAGGEEHMRISYNLTVVPEREAEYPKGYDNLIAYFEDNYKKLWGDKELESFPSAGIKFTINEDGSVTGIDQKRESEYPEIDQYIIELIREMPAWIPARDASGNHVKQEFELIFGTPGC